MKIQIISLFPEVFKEYLQVGMMRKAVEAGKVEFILTNLRDYGLGPRQTVDDTPYGGGDGMLLKPEPIVAAIETAKLDLPNSKVILMTPRGETFRQSDATGLADEGKDLIFVCARYEGYDERITAWVDEQLSIGNYVLTGGELPTLVVIDALVRLIPGVLGGDQSIEVESYSDDKTREHPQYTRPEEFRGVKVPDVLLSGNHALIDQWRRDNQINADE
ncbi:tRNA (guanosine(37)-N1)-methyltransferase TrmD [Candidatus Saccharibacteria bacterium]|nr:tRNA (guanosine(37)-N1)-methyltransferase TrmD [Candidatus Saccharibacteria bacterium]MCB9821688.1 tRNA (guanosine(37)-N1)-methyltransferase TrmD [Candidatus Nomurabacteria bacterium]